MGLTETQLRELIKKTLLNEGSGSISCCVKRLVETSNKDFLAEFLPLYDEWQELQDEYGPINPKFWTSPEGEDHRLETQDVPEDLQPDYVKNDPKFYRYYSDHPSTRRATFSQTDAEVEIEKRLLRLFQKYADQSFFNGITIYHEFNYHAAVHKPLWSELNYANFDRKDYLNKEGSRGKDVMSCHGSIDGSIRRGYGMILKGRVVFASRSDLGSQTLRTAHKKIKQKHVGSGLPKRTGPEKVHPTKKRMQSRLEFQKRVHAMNVRKGKAKPEDAPTEQSMIELLNTVVLGPEDVKGNVIEEILLGNWTIEGWYCTIHDGVPWPKEFWVAALESGIKKPVYAIDVSGNKTKIDLEQFFSEGNDEPEGLREYVKHILKSESKNLI